MTSTGSDFGLPIPGSITARAVERRFEARQDLFLEGDEAAELFGILEGRVKLWRALDDGGALTILILGPGELLGSVAVAQGGPHLVSATALDDVAVAAWCAPLFRDALNDAPDLADGFLRLVAKRADQLLRHFGDVAGLPVEKRVARVLLRQLSGADPHGDGCGAVIDIRQQDLADMALTTVPTISRIFAAWSRDGVAQAERGRLVVPRLSSLAAIAGVRLD